jgi:hypothetical protein
MFWMVVVIVGGFALLCLLGGCSEIGYKLNELHGLNCRPEALQDGKCVTTTREAKR